MGKNICIGKKLRLLKVQSQSQFQQPINTPKMKSHKMSQTKNSQSEISQISHGYNIISYIFSFALTQFYLPRRAADCLSQTSELIIMLNYEDIQFAPENYSGESTRYFSPIPLKKNFPTLGIHLLPPMRSHVHGSYKCFALQSTAKFSSSSSSLEDSSLDSPPLNAGLFCPLAILAAFTSMSCFFTISTFSLYALQ